MAVPEFYGVDRVRTEDAERLDKPDFDATMSLADEALQRQLGALLGAGGGIVSFPKTTLSLGGNPKTVTLGSFQYYLSTNYWTDDNGASYKGWKGGFFTFYPAGGNQVSVVDITSAWIFASQGDGILSKPFIYVQPVLTAMGTDARRKWIGGDSPVSMKTRSRIRHQFKISTALPEDPSNVGWAPVLQITGWSAFNNPDPGTPTFTACPWLDSPDMDQKTKDDVNWATTYLQSSAGTAPLMGVLNGTPLAGAEADSFVNVGAPKPFGLLQILHLLRSRMAQIIDYGRTTNWYAYASSQWGMKQLVAQVTANLADIVTMKSRPFVGAHGMYLFNGVDTYTLKAGTGYNISSFQRVGAGDLRITLTIDLTKYKIVGVSAHTDYLVAYPVGTYYETNNAVLYLRIRNDAGALADGQFSFTAFLEAL